MKTTRPALLAAVVLVLPASLLSSTESQLQTDLSGVLTIDFFVDIINQSNLQVILRGLPLCADPTRAW
jgi:spore coat protein CotH